MPTAALGSSASNATVFGTVVNMFGKYVASIASNLSTVVRVDVAEKLNLWDVTQC